MMDHITARLECLKLATSYHSTFPPGFQPREMVPPDKVLETAKSWAEFTIGPKVVEYAGQRPKGADEK